MLLGVLATILLVVAASAEPKCHLSKAEANHLVQPLTAPYGVIPEEYNDHDGSGISETCKKLVSEVKAAVVALALGYRIVDPNETKDAAILEKRLVDFNEAAAALKIKSDEATAALIGEWNATGQQYLIAAAKHKSSPELKMLRVIFSGNEDEAANDTDIMPEGLSFSRKVIELGFDRGNTTFLKNLILYGANFDSADFSIAAYQQIYDKMEDFGQLREPEILVLYHSITHDFEHPDFKKVSVHTKNEYLKLSKRILKAKDVLIKELVTDVEKEDYEKFTYVNENINYVTLNLVLPEIVNRLYNVSSNLNKIHKILFMFQLMRYSDNDCVGVHNLFLGLSKLNQEETFEAFNLWLYTRYVIQQEEGYSEVDEDNQKKCQFVLDALDEFKDKWINKYVKLVLREEWETIQYWHKTYPLSMRWLLPDLVRKQGLYVPKLMELSRHLPYLQDDCVLFSSIVDQVVTHSEHQRFEVLELFAGLRESTTVAEMQNVNTQDLKRCQMAGLKVPQWIKLLFRAETKFCTITNRKSGEALITSEEPINNSALPGAIGVYTKKSTDTKWLLTVESSGMANFKSTAGYLILNSQEAEIPFSSKEGVPDDASSNWFLEKAEGEYLYIFYEQHPKDGDKFRLYLSGGDKNCAENSKCVEMVANADNHQSQWKIEC